MFLYKLFIKFGDLIDFFLFIKLFIQLEVFSFMTNINPLN